MRDMFRRLVPGFVLVAVAFSGGAAYATAIGNNHSPVEHGAISSPGYRSLADDDFFTPGAPARSLADMVADAADRGRDDMTSIPRSTRFWISTGGGGAPYDVTQAPGPRAVGIGSVAIFECLSFLSFLETGNMPFRFESTAADTPSAVPEPGTFVLLAAGFPGIVLLRRMMRK